ncbi:hypothetical protein ACI2LP_33720, partial [Streptomyces sp. NPDC019890]
TVRGTAGRDLLDSYDRERRPAAQRVIANTRAQLSLMRSDITLDPLRDLFASILDVEEANRRIGMLISAQDTVYDSPGASSSSQWEGRFLQNYRITVGDPGRQATDTDVVALLHSGRPLLLLQEGLGALRKTAGRWSPTVRTVTFRSGLPCEALLVRPDGYVAWASDGGDLTQALGHWFGER